MRKDCLERRALRESKDYKVRKAPRVLRVRLVLQDLPDRKVRLAQRAIRARKDCRARLAQRATKDCLERRARLAQRDRKDLPDRKEYAARATPTRPAHGILKFLQPPRLSPPSIYLLANTS